MARTVKRPDRVQNRRAKKEVKRERRHSNGNGKKSSRVRGK